MITASSAGPAIDSGNVIRNGKSNLVAKDSGDVAANPKEGCLRQRDRAGVAEHKLKAEYEKRINAAQRQDAQIVRVGKKHRIADERCGAENERKPNPCKEPRRQVRGLLPGSDPALNKLAEDALRAEKENEE